MRATWRVSVRFTAVAVLLGATTASAVPRYQEVDLSGVIAPENVRSTFPVAVTETGLVAFAGFAGNQPYSFLFDLRSGQVVNRFGPATSCGP
jgi:hypothetical protein